MKSFREATMHKGADMPSRSLLGKSSGLAAGILLLSTAAWASTSVTSWSLEEADGRETIRLKWDEPCQVEMSEFPAARQVVVRLLDASATDAGEAPDFANSGVVEKARLQTVSMPDGKQGVQLTLGFSEWTRPTLHAAPGGLTISLDPAAVASSPAAAEPITLGNGDIDALLSGKYGSASAPADGAGQAGTNDVFTSFYVPPDITAEEKALQAVGGDVALKNTLALFERTVNLDYKDADLENVMRSIAARLKLNIVMMPGDVQGRVTVSLNNVRLGDAFDSMLRANELAYKIENGGIVRIVPRSAVQTTDFEIITQSIAINWIDASDAVQILTPFLSDEGKLSFHEQTNTLIVSDVPDSVAEIQRLLQRLDVPEKQVRLEVRLVDMTERAFRALGMQTNITSAETKSFNPVEGGVVNTDETSVIPDWNGTVGGIVEAGDGLDMATTGNVGILGSDYTVQARLTALETHNEAVVLANPTIVSLNNTPAMIEVLRKIPYQDATNTTQGSVATIKFQDVGIRLELTPRITNHGYVIQDIKTAQKIQVGTFLSTPVVDERNTLTSVISKDEQTIVLGGLRQYEAQSSEGGVPWFMRVPVLGHFFKTSDDSHTKVELALFVTPHIVKDPEPGSYNTALYEKIDYNWELPDYYFDEVRMRKAPNETIDPRAKTN